MILLKLIMFPAKTAYLKYSSSVPLSSVALTLFFLSIVATPLANADEVLFNAKYKGKYAGMTIASTRTLTTNGHGEYQIVSKMKNIFGSISETSQFTLVDGVITPSLYHYKRSLMGFKSDETIEFDWAAASAHYRRQDKPSKNKDHTLEIGTLDPVLYQLQIQRNVHAGLEAFKVSFAKPNKIKTLLFHKTEEDTLNVGGKTYPAIKLERINIDDTKKTHIWVIPALNHQIGRIEHIEEDGDSYNFYLSEYEASANLVTELYPAATRK
ncbi:DUF3108 domain-containing protein [Teredinibacter purpureus]|uniref:DUF3108 domain-containing protein n=1 Tax=Teredinibacter purpureus TaxID=2731756 RepID=UPI001F22D4F2|nr:DUF3108 domain-containing protein [Teredinibacter purpureus]